MAEVLFNILLAAPVRIDTYLGPDGLCRLASVFGGVYRQCPADATEAYKDIWELMESIQLSTRKYRMKDLWRKLRPHLKFARKSRRKLDNGTWTLMHRGGSATRRIVAETHRRPVLDVCTTAFSSADTPSLYHAANRLVRVSLMPRVPLESARSVSASSHRIGTRCLSSRHTGFVTCWLRVM